jgi:hypothetical protein
MDGKTHLGASSPANPALHIPDPLSTTTPAISSSHIVAVDYNYYYRYDDDGDEKFSFYFCKTKRKWKR